MKNTIAIVVGLLVFHGDRFSTAEDVNLAPAAEAFSSHVTGGTSLAALNDSLCPESSHDQGKCSYGNWPSQGTQWVEYEWAKPINTKEVKVFWWDDHQGVRLPADWRVKYWRDDEYVLVKNARKDEVKASEYNAMSFDEINTERLRIEMDGREQFSTGILEWQVVDAGGSPDFPPSISAGVDRFVVSDGKTYLDSTIDAVNAQGSQIDVLWTKESGPGTVQFANAHRKRTTATFSTVGEYKLKATANMSGMSDSSTLVVQVIDPPPVDHLDLIDTRSYSIQSPLWSDRAKAIVVHWLPHCIDKISDPLLKEGGVNNLAEAAKKLAGQPHGRHRGYVFSNAWIYNTIESICIAVMIDPQGDEEMIASQAAMRETLDEWIPLVLAAQEPDGYIQTYFPLNGLPRWSPEHRSDHEGYVAGYLLEAGIAHYLMTEKKDARLYDAARRLADCWCDNIGPSPKKPWFDGHQAMEIALVRFGRFVNANEGNGEGDRYIELAKFLLDCRDNGTEYDQSHVPVVEQYTAVGHAVRASYSYAAMADVAMETQDADYQSAVMSLWDNLVNRKYYVTGGIGSGETSEGFGPDFSLPHNAYCESCSSCGEIFMQHKLHLTHHDAKYASLYEETLFNALLGSLDIEGKNFYYPNPLDTSAKRYPWHGCPCCVGNIPRTLLMLPTWMYSKNGENLYVNLFVGSTVTVKDVDGTDVELVQTTDYPFDGAVSIKVNPKESVRMKMRIRIPQHDVSDIYHSTPNADGITSIRVNGGEITPPIEKGYAVIDRNWEVGDKIDLDLPMTIQQVHSIEKIAATRDQLAFRRGPLIYCVEDIDQEIDRSMSDTSDLKVEMTDRLFGSSLGEIPLLHGTWDNGKPLTAIPYFLRANRSHDDPKRPSRSSVWIDEIVPKTNLVD
ncbi:glycoside hydrolase family 127 protein [Rhodopirellula bahusiensis]|uniref:glycoside hydrolase family 127 protein n=1 Tax=Rhodopirellula bahusiensis TaxID=2014065 RepID=UPI003296F001